MTTDTFRIQTFFVGEMVHSLGMGTGILGGVDEFWIWDEIACDITGMHIETCCLLVESLDSHLCCPMEHQLHHTIILLTNGATANSGSGSGATAVVEEIDKESD